MRRYDRAGRKTCGDPFTIALTLLLLPYALVRYAFDCLRGRSS